MALGFFVVRLKKKNWRERKKVNYASRYIEMFVQFHFLQEEEVLENLTAEQDA